MTQMTAIMTQMMIVVIYGLLAGRCHKDAPRGTNEGIRHMAKIPYTLDFTESFVAGYHAGFLRIKFLESGLIVETEHAVRPHNQNPCHCKAPSTAAYIVVLPVHGLFLFPSDSVLQIAGNHG